MAAIDHNLKLVFVYNADSSLASQILDFAHKVVSPQTYRCNLCRISHGAFGAKQEWKEFIENLPCGAAFRHKDEFLSQYPEWASTPLPAVFRKTGKLELALLMEEAQIAGLHSVEEFKAVLVSLLQ